MRKKVIIGIIVFLSLLITGYLIVHFSQTHTYIKEEVLASNSSRALGSTTLIGENIFSSAHNKDYLLEASKSNLNKFIIPGDKGRMIYCIEKGGSIVTKSYTRKQIADFAKPYENYQVHDCGHAKPAVEGYQSNSYFECVEDHKAANQDLAYILTETADDRYKAPMDPSEYVAIQTGKYNEIYGDFLSYKQKAAKFNKNDYYEAARYYINGYTRNDWKDWKYKYWTYVPDWSYETYLKLYRDYDYWKEYMIKDSQTFKEFSADAANKIEELTYFGYYEYYKYITINNTKNMDYTKYLAKLYYQKPEEKEDTTEVEYEDPITAPPLDDANNEVVDYYFNSKGKVIYRYRAGELIGEDIKQIAIWFRDGKAKGEDTEHSVAHNKYKVITENNPNKWKSGEVSVPFYDIATRLSTEAENYEDFGDQLSSDDSNAIRLQNTTVQQKVKIMEDATTDYITVGPFSMEYVEGIYNNIAFGGISNMWVEGYNYQGEKIEELIPVEKFIIENRERTPQYFKPSTADKRYTDRTDQLYPGSHQEFYVKFKNPNAGKTGINRVEKINVRIEFEWMRADAEICYLEGGRDKIVKDHTEIDPHCHGHKKENGETYDCGSCCKDCQYKLRVEKDTNGQQDLIDTWGSRKLYSLTLDLFDQMPSIGMKLGGYVWEDGVSNKETKADGVNHTKGENVDKVLPDVKVSLYEYDPSTGKSRIADLTIDSKAENISEEEKMHRVNPTLTDKNGYYQFNGMDVSKKFYVVFEYNGQVYLPTDYLVVENAKGNAEQKSSVSEMVNVKLYNTESWYINSKALESEKVRDRYDKNYAQIDSSPKNYPIIDEIGVRQNYITGYNKTYTQNDLLGLKLNEKGSYEKKGLQLINTYEQEGDKLVYSQGIISKELRSFIQENGYFPRDEQLKEFYQELAKKYRNRDEDIDSKLQFIWDCQIQAYTAGKEKNDYLLKGPDVSLDLYPVYDKFVIDPIVTEEEKLPDGEYRQVYDGFVDISEDTIFLTEDEKDTIVYHSVYDGQFYVNLGLWRRQEYDAALRKDVYKATLKINNKTVVYQYDKRDQQENDGANRPDGDDYHSYWDINVRMSKYETYYGEGYNREIYKADYEYDSSLLSHPGADLEVYITYKITVRNQSQSIMTQITEVVDYYDKDYEYRNDLSWINDGNVKVPDDKFYAAMVAEDTSQIGEKVKSSKSSIFGEKTHSDITDYKAVYVQGLENKKLASGENAYIYLTFQLKKDRDNHDRIIWDRNNNSAKDNLAEINGYKTFYAKNTQLPNSVKKGTNDVAGIIDRDSNPGNLTQKDIRDNDKYEKNFEDDTDRAKSLRIIVDDNMIREVNGTVWEDERTNKVDDSIIGDGVRKDNEIKIAGVTVQLVEKAINGKEYVWQETTTDQNGYYKFRSYIPGDYIIRFYYGNTTDTVNTSTNGGKNPVSYNGQDFKSTLYQSDIEQSSYNGKQNETGTYQYNIYAADAHSENVSDAKDLWTVSMIPHRDYHPSNKINEQKAIQSRATVNSYSSTNVTNHIAEVLASPYERPSYNGRDYTDEEMNDLINELITNTYMTAETGVITIEFEYDRQQTDGLEVSNNGSKQYLYGNDVNGNYKLNNVDLGITERPKAQLEIDKSITNVKVTLANSSILFDINGSDTNAIWKDHTEYNLASKKINGKYNEYYGNKNKHRYSYRETVKSIVDEADNGLIQLTMDEELMHGATIQITYRLEVTNVGEVDYEGEEFYYKGNATGNIVTTTANQVVDYVANNLQFNISNTDNNGWHVIKAGELKSQGLVNEKLSNNLAKFNNIIQTEGLNKVLKPGEEVQKTLVLTQLITTQNKEDDLTYSNMTEIIKTSNAVGRRMAYSVVGNQNPTDKKAAEVDSSVAEKVVILPPFGETHFYYLLGAVIAIILIGSILLIKKKVLDK